MGRGHGMVGVGGGTMQLLTGHTGRGQTLTAGQGILKQSKNMSK